MARPRLKDERMRERSLSPRPRRRDDEPYISEQYSSADSDMELSPVQLSEACRICGLRVPLVRRHLLPRLPRSPAHRPALPIGAGIRQRIKKR